jgi:hypothetical protein
MASRSDLQTISGRVQLISHTQRGKAGSKLHIFVRGSDRLHHLTQEDLTDGVPTLKTQQVGDLITAMARPDMLGRDLDWLWELRRNDVMLLTFEETKHYLEHRNDRVRTVAFGAAVFSVALFILGVVLRRRFGAWQGAT